ncbi:MAG: BatA domain-containing protein [Thermomicrobiales bacterium]|nr:BatA domain-containing protein [Thermomicrobiales bacterium]
MSLLAPLGLLALVALPTIVLLHMRHTTPREKPIPTLRFWLAAEPKPTRRPRLRRPPFTLLLLLQLLAAAALAIALARPVVAGALAPLGFDLRTEPRHLLVLLDGSTSMAARGSASGTTRYEEARAEAVARLGALGEGDVATVLALGSRIETFSATDAAGLNALRARLAALPMPGGRADLDAALALAHDLLLPDRANDAVVLTDGAVAVDPTTAAAFGAPLELVRFAGSGGSDNVAVVSIATRGTADAGSAPTLYTRIANFGPVSMTAPVVLRADGIEMDRQQTTVPADGGAVDLAWPLPPGATEATVAVETNDALPADDVASLPIGAGAGSLSLRILLASDLASPLARALAALDGAAVTIEPTSALTDPAALAPYDLIVVEGAASTPDTLAALKTPLLIVAPLAGGPLPVTGMMSDSGIERLRAGDPLLRGVDLSGVSFGEAPIVDPGSGGREVVGAGEGPLILRDEIGGEPAIVFAFDLTASNLPHRIAFPVLVANAVAELAPAPLPATVPLGDPATIQARSGTAAIEIIPPAGPPAQFTFDPLMKAGGVVAPREASFEQTGQPGAYLAIERDAAGNETGRGRFVVNAGHSRESDLRPNLDLPAVLATARSADLDTTSGSAITDLWPLLALAALALAILEWLIALLPHRRAVRRPAGATSP